MVGCCARLFWVGRSYPGPAGKHSMYMYAYPCVPADLGFKTPLGCARSLKGHRRSIR
jgi:hypothetical protein